MDLAAVHAALIVDRVEIGAGSEHGLGTEKARRSLQRGTGADHDLLVGHPRIRPRGADGRRKDQQCRHKSPLQHLHQLAPSSVRSGGGRPGSSA